uniref:Allophycocyanin beta 18 subunit n=1 Tax=Gloeochaete wittrockiana TaxID=38269 RepID=A0A3G1IVV2_9EUKA|nr:allophycocyanin beta 18 subunit [Gloeochaete wittrockiana]ASQ40153.1 allophycocyanin beta 18 subunit [Gloeochaete wittrockiana]
MKDAISAVIEQNDVNGKYVSIDSIDKIQVYLKTGLQRLTIAKVINSNSPEIIKKAADLMFLQSPELLRPGGNANTTRRYAACLRDLEYYLRYSYYSIIAGDFTILDERVLNGLKQTYNILGVPVGPTVAGINNIKEVIKELINSEDSVTNLLISEPFDYLSIKLSERNI